MDQRLTGRENKHTVQIFAYNNEKCEQLNLPMSQIALEQTQYFIEKINKW